MDTKEIIGLLAVIISLVGYAPYLYGIARDIIKPHAFSWCVWTLLTGIAFAIQVSENGGAGSWITGVITALCLIVFIIALFRGEKDIKRSDVVSFVLALSAIPLWVLTDEPLFAAILISVIDLFGFYPTYRKSWEKPYEETVGIYALAAIAYALSIIALTSFTPENIIYPASLVITQGGFVLFLLWRRCALTAT